MNAFFKVCKKKCSTSLNKRFLTYSPFRVQIKIGKSYGNNFFSGLIINMRHPPSMLQFFHITSSFFSSGSGKSKIFKFKNSKNFEIFQKLYFAIRCIIFLKSTKITFSYHRIISTCRMMPQVISKVCLDSKEHFLHVCFAQKNAQKIFYEPKTQPRQDFKKAFLNSQYLVLSVNSVSAYHFLKIDENHCLVPPNHFYAAYDAQNYIKSLLRL